MTIIPILLVALLSAGSDWTANFPEDDVVVIEHETRITIMEGGAARVWQRRVLRPLTLYGREEFTDFRIPFFEPRQTVRMLTCKVITGEGKEIHAEPHAFNPVTPGGYGRAPDFVGFRELVVSPSGVEEKSEIVIEYVVEDTLTIFPWFEANIPIGDRHPVLTRTVRIENQSGLPMKWQLLNVEGGQPGQDSLAVWWSFKDLPAYPTSGAGPMAETIVPRLLVTTCPSWEALSSWCFSAFPPDDSLPAELLDSVQVSLTKAVTKQDTLKKISEIVGEATISIPAPTRKFWAVRSYSRVLETGRAEPWEVCGLLVSMARRLGHDATVCMVGSPLSQETLPILALLKHPAILVEGGIPDWIDVDGVHVWPWRHGPFSYLPCLPEGGALGFTTGIGAAVGTGIITLLPEGDDSLSLKGSISVSAALIPDGDHAGEPESWLEKRLKAVVGENFNIEIRPETITREGASYTFSGGISLEERIEIDGHLRGVFGSEWVPPKSSDASTKPRVPILVPLNIDLSIELRIEKSDKLNMLFADNSLHLEEVSGVLDVFTERAGKQVRLSRRLRLKGGWLTGEGVDALRLLLRSEGQRATRSLVIMVDSE